MADLTLDDVAMRVPARFVSLPDGVARQIGRALLLAERPDAGTGIGYLGSSLAWTDVRIDSPLDQLRMKRWLRLVSTNDELLEQIVSTARPGLCSRPCIVSGETLSPLSEEVMGRRRFVPSRTRTYPRCGTVFAPRSPNHTYCSSRCTYAARKRDEQTLYRFQKRHRRTWAPIVASGTVRCARAPACRFAEWVAGEFVGGLIPGGDGWDLGHPDIERPEGAYCRNIVLATVRRLGCGRRGHRHRASGELVRKFDFFTPSLEIGNRPEQRSLIARLLASERAHLSDLRRPAASPRSAAEIAAVNYSTDDSVKTFATRACRNS